jgi:hypothetical protein
MNRKRTDKSRREFLLTAAACWMQPGYRDECV